MNGSCKLLHNNRSYLMDKFLDLQVINDFKAPEGVDKADIDAAGDGESLEFSVSFVQVWETILNQPLFWTCISI